MRIPKRKKLGIVLATVAALGAFALLIVLVATGNICITSTVRPKDAWTGAVPHPVSGADADGDGVADGEDIVCAALAYVQTRPAYKSAYYASGYPDDGCGVCTDVVAISLREAGYDLQRLIEEDAEHAPEAYPGIVSLDPAIDFRRVINQRSYFERHAVSLTVDTSRTDQWVAGDIVVYDDHVGIVSDRRDAEGVPYLIHHSGPFQRAYEQDCLATYGKIEGHYRMEG